MKRDDPVDDVPRLASVSNLMVIVEEEEETSRCSMYMSQMSLLQECGRRNSMLQIVEKNPDEALSGNVPAHDDISTCDTASSSDIYTDHNENLDAILNHLCSETFDEKSHGLEHLMEAILNTDRQGDACISEGISDASSAILFVSGIYHEELQGILSSFISDTELKDDTDEDSFSESSSYCSLPSDLLSELRAPDGDYDSIDGRRSHVDNDQDAVALELQTLLVISSALQQMVSSAEHSGMMRCLNCDTIFWQRVISASSENLQNFDSTDPAVVKTSLSILRLLHESCPGVIDPLLQYTLLPYLLQIEEYFRGNKVKEIGAEADMLLKKVDCRSCNFGFEV